jgi:hypothetical protein
MAMIKSIIYFLIMFMPSAYCFGCANAAAASASSVINANSKISSSSVTSINKQDANKDFSSIANATLNQSASIMECYRMVNSSNESTFVCAMKPPATVWLSAIVSVIALIISLGGFLYTFKKDKKERLQSIEDDYWIRKVISPIALEPLIKKITEAVSNIPNDCQSKKFDVKVCDEFGKKFQLEWNQLSCSMNALALLDKDVLITARKHASNIEDEVLLYCSNNVEGKIGANGGCIIRPSLQDKIITEMVAIMSCIKQYQISKI